MKVPSELKPAFWGAVGGAVALAIIGFTFGGWVTASTAEAQARQRTDAALVSALAPICAERFHQEVNAATTLAELKTIKSWDQAAFVEKGGWATMPGKESPEAGVAKACATILGAQT